MVVGGGCEEVGMMVLLHFSPGANIPPKYYIQFVYKYSVLNSSPYKTMSLTGTIIGTTFCDNSD